MLFWCAQVAAEFGGTNGAEAAEEDERTPPHSPKYENLPPDATEESENDVEDTFHETAEVFAETKEAETVAPEAEVRIYAVLDTRVIWYCAPQTLPVMFVRMLSMFDPILMYISAH